MKILPIAFSCALLLTGATLPQAPAEDDLQLLPQVFNLDERNRSTILVQNTTEEEISVGIQFLTQDGALACVDGLECPVASFRLDPLATLQLTRLPQPFVGSAAIFCTGRCVASAGWNLEIREDSRFTVGVLPSLFSRRARVWGSPIPTISEGSLYGLAVYNTTTASTLCIARYYTQTGSVVSEEEIQIFPDGQFSGFASGVGPGFAGSTLLTCENEVAATAIVQDSRNAFPTTLNYSPLTDLGTPDER